MQTFETYESEDIVFISLTQEGPEAESKIQSWAQDLGITWSVGFAAAETLSNLEVPGYPTTFVINRDGKVAWHSFLGGNLERAVQSAL